MEFEIGQIIRNLPGKHLSRYLIYFPGNKMKLAGMYITQPPFFPKSSTIRKRTIKQSKQPPGCRIFPINTHSYYQITAKKLSKPEFLHPTVNSIF